MPRISRSKFKNEELKELIDNFSYLLSSMSNKEETENFLESFFTKEEKLMLAKRLVLFMMIQKEYPQTTIQQALKISYETVRTYTNQFENKNALFQKTIERLISREKAKEFWKKVDRLLKPLELALNAKRNMKSRAKLLSGDFR